MELTQANKAILQRNAEQVILGKKTNVLLVRDDVGHANQPQEHCLRPISALENQKSCPTETLFAKVIHSNSYNPNFNLVTTEWVFHQNSQIKKVEPRDFKRLNKMSLKDGSVNARDQYKYRSSHDARIHFGLTNEKPIKIPEESFVFGKVTRA